MGRLMDLLAIFDIVKLSELKAHCRSVTVHGDDMFKLILAAKTGAIPIRHHAIFRHHQPKHLALTQDDLRGLMTSPKGRITNRDGLKAVRKIDEMFRQRRLLNIHLFWPPQNPGEWHLFYWDQHDTDVEGTHWSGGRHIHLMNMLTHPRIDPDDLIRKLYEEDRPKLGRHLHLRWVR